ncbi:hypothetical protein CTAM01_14346 [Colletotrichum tamarilloi]|uniref:Peptidase S8/S53 domain-containing protein n=1 Tax=Colletotrichum tamarilloi TaxID=1209934 RepID=A0ABQ9QPF6_9PEZI|nr:uncharacterized protein CTAM01_14346 [Colletotrichum tamarilloi]KAK1480506.1 hypothetical protein CTAM01_14346 [Colletotrichum tamarilloi]
MTTTDVATGDATRGPNDIKSSERRGRLAGDKVKTRRIRDSDQESSDEEGARVGQYHGRIVKKWIQYPADADHPKYGEFHSQKDNEERNLIHRTIRELSRKQKDLPPHALTFIESLVVDSPDLFVAKDSDQKVPMLEAANSQVAILFRIINLLIPSEIRDAIKTECQDEKSNCPLQKVVLARRKQCSINPGKASKASKTDTIQTADPEQGLDSTRTEISGIAERTECLHGQVDVKRLLEKDHQLRKKLVAALKPHEQAQLCLQSLLVDTKFDKGQKKSDQVVPLPGFKTLLQLCPDDLFSNQPSNGYTPLQMAVKLYGTEDIDYDLLFFVIQALIDRCPASIFLKHKGEKNAYKLLKSLDEAKSTKNASSRALAEELLKRSCIGFPEGLGDARSVLGGERNDSWAKKMDFLYWDAKLGTSATTLRELLLALQKILEGDPNSRVEQRFYLNLTGESVMLDKAYINTIKNQSGLRLETVLDFVKLPYWKPQDRNSRLSSANARYGQHQNHSPSEGKDVGEPELPTLDPYGAMFDWLWGCNVRKIFTIDVDDDGPEPHTNASIRKAFRGENDSTNPTRDFEVEVWKWKKFDICAETVATAAPKAQHIYFYSRGNTAVLRGWASSPGQLEKLNIEIFPENVNDEEDCRVYEPNFKETLAQNCARLKIENISVKNHGYRRDLGANEAGNEGMSVRNKGQSRHEQSTPDTNAWIGYLLNFKQFMHNLELSNKPSIKVALLDDGAKLTDLHGQQNGRSFRADKEEFFVGPCEHGTAMARCIREVCPMAELYIARLDDSRHVENQKFTITSCHQALQWALDMEVDIVSMSWTFERKGITNDEAEEAFVKLAKQAIASGKVILFGSLPDKGPGAQTSEFLPIGMDGVLKIGAATLHGQSSAENIHSNPDFLLPGESLFSPTGEIVQGSSYATAYASGLAAIVLYCVKAHQELEEVTEDDEMHKAWDMAKRVKGMKIIFNRLSQKNSEYRSDRGAFVQPYIVFGQDFKDSRDDKRNALRRIVTEILPPDVLRSFHIE